MFLRRTASRQLFSAAVGATFLLAASVATAQLVEIRVAPPAARVEVRGPAPSPRHVWIDGFWQWNGGAHVWVPGRWDMPQQAGASWRAARWVQTGAGWKFEPGAWVVMNAPTVVTQAPAPVAVQVVAPGVAGNVIVAAPPAPPPPAPGVVVQVQPPGGIITVAPPALRVEPRPAPPAPNFVWVPGYWQWGGQGHVWVAGHWEQPMSAGATWETPRWVRRGGGWFFMPGQWRVRPVRPGRPNVVFQRPAMPGVGIGGAVRVEVGPRGRGRGHGHGHGN